MSTPASSPKSSSALALRQAARPGGLLAVQAGTRLEAVEKPRPEAARGYMRLTAHILMQSQRRDFRTIGVVSARDGEGKTTAAVNLAVCLGRTRGRAGRVLLVDGDAHRRTLTRTLAADAEGPHPVLIETPFEGVDLMTAPDGEDGFTLHDPAAWAHTLHELRPNYAQIVIDCPSILDNPEGLVLRDCVEELVVVAQSGRTPKRALEKALAHVAKRVIGVILNGARPRSD
jgi:Mrp family chromosome partitioning ATPase